MEYLFAKRFSKDLDAIKHIPEVKNRLLEFIDQLHSFDRLTDLPNIKKIEGFPGYYRIRIGDYRIGVKLANETLILVRFLHRKEIYRRFP